jgi:uncharacterized protein YneF (UPF0154 family)
MGTFDLTHGFLLFLIGMTMTITGFLIAYFIAFKNYEKAIHKTNRKPNAIDDLMRDIPGSKQGDDCQ